MELDFEEETPFDLSEYDQYFEWDEAEYMRLRFIAARHYASRGHWDDAYAYILRTHPDNVTEHDDIYNRNTQAWHYTNAWINELIQEAEQALQLRDRQLAQWSPYRPPGDSLIPPGQDARTLLPEEGIGRVAPSPRRPQGSTLKGEQKGREDRVLPTSPLSPDRESQSEERKSVIDTVKQITGAKERTLAPEGISIGDTPEYDWNTRYDGIRGISSHLRNRVSEPSTPQRGQSPRGRPMTPPQTQIHFKQLKVYDETPTGRPLPIL